METKPTVTEKKMTMTMTETSLPLNWDKLSKVQKFNWLNERMSAEERKDYLVVSNDKLENV